MPRVTFKPTQSAYENFAYWHSQYCAALESGDRELAADLDMMKSYWEFEIMEIEQQQKWELELALMRCHELEQVQAA